MENKLTKDERKAQRKEEWQEQLKKDQQKKMMTKTAWIISSVLIIIIAFWGIINFTGTSQQDQKLIINMPPITDKDLQMGPKNAKVTLTEYADFQCPACGFYYTWVEHLKKDFNGKVRFVYRTFPLTNVHPNALPAAEVAYAASLQGKFWDMYNLLYQNREKWGEEKDPQSKFDEYGQKIGLDMDKFHKDSADAKTKTFIMDEENSGLGIGINSTPTFFINGKQVTNPQTYDQFKQDIQEALSAK